MSKYIIAIDGYSSTGKSTLAKQLAKRLGFTYIDSGAMFRAITYVAIREKIVNIKTSEIYEKKFIALLEYVNLTFDYTEEGFDVFLNGQNITRHLHSMEVANIVSAISKIPKVRAKILKIQHQIAREEDIVMDGRDIGTVVFPDANLKIFMTADPKVRAQRRYNEKLAKGKKVSFEEIQKNILSRDEQDSKRTIAPLKKADDAIVLDNTTMSIEEQLEWAQNLISKN